MAPNKTRSVPEAGGYDKIERYLLVYNYRLGRAHMRAGGARPLWLSNNDCGEHA